MKGFTSKIGKRSILLTALLSIIFSIITILYLSINLKYTCGSQFRVSSCYLEDNKADLSERLPALFPEILQVKIGSKFAFLIDNGEDTKLLADKAIAEYKKLPPEVNSLPSSLGNAYSDIVGLDQNDAHYYAFQTAPGKEIGQVVIFFHGLGGNFKIYPQILSDAYTDKDVNTLILAPSYGAGNWDSHAVQSVDHMISDAAKRFDFSINTDLQLIGLSNGGLFVPVYLNERASTNSVAKVRLISTFVGEEWEEVEKNSLKDTTICYIYGEGDNRINWEESLSRLERISESHITITYPDYGHELFLSLEGKQLFAGCP